MDQQLRGQDEQPRDLDHHQGQRIDAETPVAPEEREQTPESRCPEDRGERPDRRPRLQLHDPGQRFPMDLQRVVLVADQRVQRLPGGNQERQESRDLRQADADHRREAGVLSAPVEHQSAQGEQERRHDERRAPQVEVDAERAEDDIGRGGRRPAGAPPRLEGRRGRKAEKGDRHVRPRDAAVDDEERRQGHQPGRGEGGGPAQPPERDPGDDHQRRKAEDQRRQAHPELGEGDSAVEEETVEARHGQTGILELVGGEDFPQRQAQGGPHAVELVAAHDLGAQVPQAEERAGEHRRQPPDRGGQEPARAP
jgi:hypothetical protein